MREIAYHPGKANLVADALSRKRVALARKREVDSLVSEISTLRSVCCISGTLGLRGSESCGSFERVRLAREKDERLIRGFERSGFRVSGFCEWHLSLSVGGYAYLWMRVCGVRF
ncbi:hypothetical protein V5N11_015881 [Cardamine amara subsp. amara]|uniref:Uncharacterized protein n=1 Tax=Cardamine amara subsp. amara TaxID=228776 RepID=A0ABD1ASC5_CARAN